MKEIIYNRPNSFKTLKKAIDWSKNSKLINNQESCRISIPNKFEYDSKSKSYRYKFDLLKTEEFWNDWYEGVNDAFFNSKINKLLIIADKERMDKDLTIAFMGGKLKVVILNNNGHYVHEDDFRRTGLTLYKFLSYFHIPLN